MRVCLLLRMIEKAKNKKLKNLFLQFVGYKIKDRILTFSMQMKSFLDTVKTSSDSRPKRKQSGKMR